jgi:pyroglutamyl-peptidase
VGKPPQNPPRKPKQAPMGSLEQPRLEVTDDVGSFVCGFIYYQSLLCMHATKPGFEHPVLFLHVPILDSAERLDMGTRVTIALLKALSESYER